MTLPAKVYETLRWLIALVIPAIGVLINTLAPAWGWDIPVDAISITLNAVALFLGTVFGISKLSNDSQTKEG